MGVSLDGFIKILKGENPDMFGKLVASGEEVVLLSDLNLESGGTISNEDFSKTTICINGGNYAELIFDSVIFKKFIINGGTFKSLDFRLCKFKKEISVYGGYFEKEFRLHSPIAKIVRLRGGTFQSRCSFYGETPLLEIIDLRLEGKMQVDYFKDGIICIENIAGILQINQVTRGSVELFINLTSPSPSQIIFPETKDNSKYRVEHLHIGDISKNATVRISSMKVRNIVFENSAIQGNLFISETGYLYPNEKALIKIKNSDLGSTNFINCIFEFHHLEFISSKITNIFISGTQFPTVSNINIEPDHIDDQDKFDANKREALSQLKKVYESKGDSIESAKFRSAELNSYSKTLKWKKNFPEKFVLKLNEFSSNHGQNWVRAFFITILTGLFFYIFYCNALGYSIFLVSPNHKLDLLLLFPEFLNPLHRADFIPEKLGISNVHSGAFAIENVARVSVAFCIYQFIQAFRKHGLK